jgi:hypothetical protein
MLTVFRRGEQAHDEIVSGSASEDNRASLNALAVQLVAVGGLAGHY